MTPKIEIKRPGFDFVRRLAPEPRRALKKALNDLLHGRGDISSLEQGLIGYNRLRIGKYRLIFRYIGTGDIEAIFIEERPIVYEVFESQVISRLKS